MKSFFTVASAIFFLLFLILGYFLMQETSEFEIALQNVDFFAPEEETYSDRFGGLSSFFWVCTGVLVLALAAMAGRAFTKETDPKLTKRDIQTIEKEAETSNQKEIEKEQKEQERLEAERIENQKRANELFEKFLDFKPTGDTAQKRSDELLKKLAPILEISQGMVYTRRGEASLALTATYAIIDRGEEKKSMSFGEGFVGEVAKRKEYMIIDDIPEGYIKIFSGLGAAVPNSLLFLPFVNKGELLGVMELATFKKFNEFERGLLHRLSEAIGKEMAAVVDPGVWKNKVVSADA